MKKLSAREKLRKHGYLTSQDRLELLTGRDVALGFFLFVGIPMIIGVIALLGALYGEG